MSIPTGASTIQSADVVSSCVTWTVRTKVLRRVRSDSCRRTRCPVTETEAVSWSPGSTVMAMLRDGAGTSSYQTVETGCPARLQSISEPICSKALELML